MLLRGLVLVGLLLTFLAPVAPSGAVPDSRPGPQRIAGGYIPDANAWPWVTALIDVTRPAIDGDFGRGACTAVLIAPDRVLTAAHCVVGADRVTPKAANGFQVLVGRRDLTEVNQGQRRNVTGIVVHPQAYLPVTGVHTHHAFYDIAVLFLDSPVTTIPPATIGLPTDWSTWATVMGFGHYNLDHDPADRLYDEHLRAADYDLLGDNACGAAFNDPTTQHFYPAIHVCANNAPNSATVDCITHGDSGGPLMIRMTDGTWRLIGITSFYPYRADRCGAGGPFGFAWVAGDAMRGWPLTVAPPPPTTAPVIGSPGRVRSLGVNSRRSSRKFTISWSPPSTNGGAAIAGYELRVYKGKKLLVKREVSASQTKVTMKKSTLRRGKNKVYVTAFNGSRYSPWTVLTVRRSR